MINRAFPVVLIALAGLGIGEGCNRNELPTTDTSATVTHTAFNAAGAPTIAFNAPDMMCEKGCGAKVKEILSKQPGAKEVFVDFEAKRAIVALDSSAKFDASAALAALADHGFRNSTIKSAANSNALPAAPTTSEPIAQ